MNWTVVGFWALFAAALSVQIIAIWVRQLYVSLFFSFIHSVLIAIILMAMSNYWLGLAELWLMSGVNYLGLVKTSMLLGPQKEKPPTRRLTFSLAASIIAVSLFMVVSSVLTTLFGGAFNFSSIAIKTQNSAIVTLSLFALSALISVYLLVRRDDIEKRGDSL